MGNSKRKSLQPFRFRSSEEDIKRQYDALFGVSSLTTTSLPLEPIPIRTSLTETTPTVGESNPPTLGALQPPSVDAPETPIDGISEQLPPYEELTSKATQQTPTDGVFQTSTEDVLDRPTVDVSGLAINQPDKNMPTVDVYNHPTIGVLNGSKAGLYPQIHRSLPGPAQTHTVSVLKPPTTDGYSWFRSLDEKQLFDARGVRRISIVQDILSNVEFGYYRKLWDASGGDFRVLQKDESAKVFQAGYASLSKLLNMDRRSVVRYVVEAFRSKYVLDVLQAGEAASRSCAIYRMYSFREILNRLRQSGCIYAKKSGKAVYLVQPFTEGFFGKTPTVEVLETPPVGGLNPPPAGVLQRSAVGKTPTVDATPTVTMDGTPTGAIGVLRSDSLLDFIERNSFRENDVVVVERYLAATAEFQNFDRQAIRTICRQGREAVPDITAEEICTVFVERARPLLQNRRIENLNGLVLTMWKSWLTPARIELLREEKRRLAEQQAESTAEIDQSARRMLNDPLATESEKNIARQILGDCLKPHG